MRVELSRYFTFEAAHRLQEDQPLHGHSYHVRVEAAGESDANAGWLIDFGDIAALCRPVIEQLDHRNLNDIPELDRPSLGAVRAYLERGLAEVLPSFHAVDVRITGDCAYRPQIIEPGEDEPGRIRFTFEAAHFLPRAPQGHKCRGMHGHSFRIEAEAAEPSLLEEPLRGLYGRLDRRILNEEPGLENPTVETLSRWMWERLEGERGGLKSLKVQETDSAYCVYRGK